MGDFTTNHVWLPEETIPFPAPETWDISVHPTHLGFFCTEIEVPPVLIHFNEIFHYKPSIFGVTILGKPRSGEWNIQHRRCSSCSNPHGQLKESILIWEVLHFQTTDSHFHHVPPGDTTNGWFFFSPGVFWSGFHLGPNNGKPRAITASAFWTWDKKARKIRSPNQGLCGWSNGKQRQFVFCNSPIAWYNVRPPVGIAFSWGSHNSNFTNWLMVRK